MIHRENEVRLATLCPQPLIALGLARTFQDESGVKIVQEFPSLAQCAREASACRPQVILIDWDMVPHDVESTDQIRALARQSAVMLLMHSADSDNSRVALELGARGTLDKACAPAVIRRAVRKVAQGGHWVGQQADEEALDDALLANGERAPDPSRMAWLTRRERQIADLICRGYRNKRIADELQIAETTVCHHLTSIFNKLEVKDRLGLLVFSHQNAQTTSPKSDRRHYAVPDSKPSSA